MKIEIWLTFGLLFSAVAQAFFTWWQGQMQRRIGEEAAARELKARIDAQARRRADDTREKQRISTVLWAESIRIQGLALHWTTSSVVERVVRESLDPKDFRLENAAELVRGAAMLSREAGTLAALVPGQCITIEQLATSIVRLVQSLAHDSPRRGFYEVVAFVRTNFPDLETRVALLQDQIAEMSAKLWDASRHYEHYDRDRAISFLPDSRSKIAKELRGEDTSD